MTYWHTDILTSWNPELLTSWRTDILTSWHPELLTSWHTDILTYWHTDILIDILTSWHPDILNSWHFDILTSWHPDILTFWLKNYNRVNLTYCRTLVMFMKKQKKYNAKLLNLNCPNKLFKQSNPKLNLEKIKSVYSAVYTYNNAIFANWFFRAFQMWNYKKNLKSFIQSKKSRLLQMYIFLFRICSISVIMWVILRVMQSISFLTQIRFVQFILGCCEM